MKGFVYKITNEDESIVYIGSTTKSLKVRWNHHKTYFKKWSSGSDRCHAMIYHSFHEYGIENFAIHLISEHEIDNRNQLLEFEQKVIDTTENTVNKQKAYTGMNADEYQKQYSKQYYIKNKDKIRERNKEYNEKNKEAVAVKNKEYREENKEKMRELWSKHYEANKEKIKQRAAEWNRKNRDKVNKKKAEKITCRCGSEISRINKSRHESSKKHLSYVENQ